MSEQEELATGGAIRWGAVERFHQQYGDEWFAKQLGNPPVGSPNYGTNWIPANREPEPYQPSNAFPTLAELKAFVKRCVDERLDELARDMRENPAFQPSKVQ